MLILQRIMTNKSGRQKPHTIGPVAEHVEKLEFDLLREEGARFGIQNVKRLENRLRHGVVVSLEQRK
jgi:hypothetical protein